MTQPTPIAIRRADLLALAAVVPKKTHRHQLQGVAVKSHIATNGGGTFLVATNGPALAAVRLYATPSIVPDVTVPLDALDKLPKKGADEVTLTHVDGADWTLDDNGLSIPFTDHVRHNGQFPDWTYVLPAKDNTDAGKLAQFDHKVLALVAKVGQIASGRPAARAPIPFIQYNGTSAAVVTFDDLPDLLCLLMPFRHASKDAAPAHNWY